MKPAGVPLEKVEVAAYRIPTDVPEADGTLEWDATTLVVVQIAAGGQQGLGYGYANDATARLIAGTLAAAIAGLDALAIPSAWNAMVRAIRNLGRPGICSMAIACVDVALWDLKARLLGLPLVALLGAARSEIPLYGSGGFTSYDASRLDQQLGDWAASGFRAVKMKIGAQPERDLDRVGRARAAIGAQTELFVDANGAYERKQALAFAERFAELGVTWFEEPVSSDDLEGLRLIRDRGPAGMRIAAGEYGYDAPYFARLAGVVDVLQADATRCAGITGFLQVAALASALGIPLSAHTAPALHLHPCCAAPARMAPLEWFHDHARIEALAFDGAVQPVDGVLRPDPGRPGHGLALRHADLKRFEVM